ncbi:MAG: hypothetical protein AAB367_00625 [Patescibacteria group bacterium]
MPTRTDILTILAMLAFGLAVVGFARWWIPSKAKKKGDGSPDDPQGGESRPLMQNDPDDGHRYAALDMLDGRRSVSFEKGTLVSTRHEGHEVFGKILGEAGANHFWVETCLDGDSCPSRLRRRRKELRILQ